MSLNNDSLKRKLINHYFDFIHSLSKSRLINNVNLEVSIDGVPAHMFLPIFRSLIDIFRKKDDPEKPITNPSKIGEAIIENKDSNLSTKYFASYFLSILLNREHLITLVLDEPRNSEIKVIDIINPEILTEDFMKSNSELNNLKKEDLNNIDSIEKIFIDAFSSELFMGTIAKSFDSNRHFLSEELVMHLAYFEAFLSDTLRIIFEKCPEKICEMKSEIATEDFIKLDRDVIIQELITNIIKDFNYKSIKGRIIFLKNLDIISQLSKQKIKQIETLYKIRNLIVHNGSRADKEYLKISKDKKTKINELIPINNNLLELSFELLSELSFQIVSNISKKYFQIKIQKHIKLL